MLQANSLLLILSRANRIGVLPRLLAGFAGSQAPVRVALRGRHFRGMIAPNNSFNPNPLRCFVQTCRKLLQCRLTTFVAAGRVNSGVRRVKARATAGFSASVGSSGHSPLVVAVFGRPASVTFLIAHSGVVASGSAVFGSRGWRVVAATLPAQ